MYKNVEITGWRKLEREQKMSKQNSLNPFVNKEEKMSIKCIFS